jgi:hypothetical protein
MSVVGHLQRPIPELTIEAARRFCPADTAASMRSRTRVGTALKMIRKVVEDYERWPIVCDGGGSID